jgi:hypothetical protein
MNGLTVVAGVGIALADRLLLGESVWVKPLKFEFAFFRLPRTVAWPLTKLRKAKRLGRRAGTGFAVAATAEVAAIRRS